MSLKTILIYIGKLLLVSLAFSIGVMVGGMVVTLLGFQPPQLPEGSDTSLALQYLLLESPLLALALAAVAGGQPQPTPLGVVPGALCGLLLIPILQIVGVAATLWRLRCWRQDPKHRPSGGRKWGQNILLPLIPNLLVTLTLIPTLGEIRGFLMLFMLDVSWIALVCGGSSLVWSFLRTGLILRTLRKPSSPQTFVGRLSTEH